jgi:type I restriction enzyme S subunit
MRSDYKPLGNYIQLVDERNTALEDLPLMGLSISKEFIPSVANIVGTDLSKYKIVKKDQFACSLMQVSRDGKIPIAIMKHPRVIMSPAYPIFEVKRTDELFPEYLMMWFSRSEFDRQAAYYAVGGVRGSLEWEDFCDMQLPVPPITKQREIVKEYNVIQNRIALNQQLIQKLEETAQAVYKRWFVDFEFPDENGLPFKSNGGEMVWNEELGKEVPRGWEVGKLGDVVKCNYATLSTYEKFDSIDYLETSGITSNKIVEIRSLVPNIDKIPSRAKRKVNHNDIVFSTVRPNLHHYGIIKYPKPNMIVSTGFAVLKPNYPNVSSELIYLLITQEDILLRLQARAEMSVSTYPSINPEDILNLSFIVPSKNYLKEVTGLFKSLFDLMEWHLRENKLLNKMEELVLSKVTKS